MFDSILTCKNRQSEGMEIDTNQAKLESNQNSPDVLINLTLQNISPKENKDTNQEILIRFTHDTI